VVWAEHVSGGPLEGKQTKDQRTSPRGLAVDDCLLEPACSRRSSRCLLSSASLAFFASISWRRCANGESMVWSVGVVRVSAGLYARGVDAGVQAVVAICIRALFLHPPQTLPLLENQRVPKARRCAVVVAVPQVAP
jgi:hypothetical protein